MHSRPPAIHFEQHQTNHDKEKQKGIASSSGLEAQGWGVSPQPNMTSYAVIRKISSSRTDGEMDSISNINFVSQIGGRGEVVCRSEVSCWRKA